MEKQMDRQFALPKNIRQMGSFGDTYKIYVEDFVYTYVHQFLHRKKEENNIIAAVLLGETIQRENQEYVFISGAQKVDLCIGEETEQEEISVRQQEFWNSVYQGIKEYFSDREILGWYINQDGSGLELNQQLQQFFEETYSKGSRFLYYEDSLEKQDAFFVQEQHSLQRVTGYAVYYEKNPQMQEFMIAEKERLMPKAAKNVVNFENQEDDVAQNYRAIMNKLHEKPAKKKVQPAIYVAGVAVLAVVTATGITQIGNYQNLKTLESTLQTLSGSVTGNDASEEEKEAKTQEENQTPGQTGAEAQNPESAAETSSASEGSETDGEQNQDGQAAAEADAAASQTVQESADSNVEVSAADATQTAEQTPSSADAGQQQNYYTVKKGDSLVSISRTLYNTTDKIEEICALNNIENMDVIYEGQKLLLP